MSYVEGTTGPMLQGVSQQPARRRVEGQVTEQVNYDSDVAKGLTSRPGSTQVLSMDGGHPNMEFAAVDFKGNQYIIGHRNGVLEVWDTAGVRYTTTLVQDTGYLDVGEMVFFSDAAAEVIYVLNRNRITAMDAGPAVGRPFHTAFVTCLGGQFFRTYKVTITVGSDSVSFEYDTPDGTNASDGEKTASDYITRRLRDAFNALSLPASMTGMTVAVSESTLMIEFDEPMDVSVDDGENGAVLRAVTDTAKDITFLPETAKHGSIVKVTEGRSKDDDYFLRFESDVTTTEGAGFGKSGVWREVADPDLVHSFTPQSMPHKLTIDRDTQTATYDRLEWFDRRVGDDNTNPVPPFIGSPIRDISNFEGRTVLLAGGRVYMGRSEEPLDLWKRSATVEVDDDPIDVRSTAVSGVDLDWIIPFDRNLLLVADPGAAQFVITGGGLTPSNASMTLTTQYTVVSGVRPVSTGRTIILPYKTGNFVGVNEFFTNDLVSTNGADPLTATQDRYITGNLTNIQSAENFSRVAFQTDADLKQIFLYRFLWDGTERLQSAWHSWKFTDDVRHMFFDSSSVYVILRPTDGSTILCRMDLNRIEDDVGFHITLDRRQDLTVDASNQVTTALENASIVQRTGCTQPGLLALVVNKTGSPGAYTYTLDADMCPEGATVTVGDVVARELKPTMPQPKNFRGEVISGARLEVKAFHAHLENSGDMTAVKQAPYTGDRTLNVRRFPRDDDPLDPNRTGAKDYVLRIPWREKSDRAELSIQSTDIRPDTILEIEWSGDLRRSRRRI